MSDTYKPTTAVAAAAQRALKWIEEGFAGSGFTDVGRRRASQLANRQPVSADTIRRMNSYFARHEVDKQGKNFNNMEKPSAGRVAWDAWGGDAGKKWAAGIVKQLDKEEEKSMAIETKATNVAETTAYAPIVKFEEMDNGNLFVYGKATDDTLDSDDQICDPAWLDSAMPKWFKFGNIREQHSNIAAGVAVEYSREEDGHYIGVEVVDDNSKKKVRARVLKGFSIGIRRPRVIKDNKAAGGRIIDGEIVEVSLVDRPANPACVLAVAKADGSDTLVQVEEFLKGESMGNELQNDGLVVAEPMNPDKLDLTDSENDSHETALRVIGRAKAIAGDTVEKFDAGVYRAARAALAQLIAIEANELNEGHDERMSLAHLLTAVHNLLSWYEGEEEEGEVSAEDHAALEPSERIEETIEMSAKCLDCGCHMPSDSHGRDDVSVAEIISDKADDEVVPAEGDVPAEEKMCKECGKAEAECECEANEEIELAINGDNHKNENLTTLIEEVVKSLLTNNDSELQTKAAASEERVQALEEELKQVKSLAASGGPRRMGAANKTSQESEVMQAVHELQYKATQTLDAKLAEGYRLKANDLIKSIKKDGSNG